MEATYTRIAMRAFTCNLCGSTVTTDSQERHTAWHQEQEPKVTPESKTEQAPAATPEEHMEKGMPFNEPEAEPTPEPEAEPTPEPEAEPTKKRSRKHKFKTTSEPS